MTEEGTVHCNNGLSPPTGAFSKTTGVCGLMADGGLVCWDGESVPPPGEFIDLDTSKNHGCAVAVDGHVECWGDNTYGQATPSAGTFTQISTWADVSCGLTTDGGVECWGWDFKRDESPSLEVTSGDADYYLCGAHADHYIDIGVLGDEEYTYVSASYSPCAVRADGKVICWGYNCDGLAFVPDDFGPE